METSEETDLELRVRKQQRIRDICFCSYEPKTDQTNDYLIASVVKKVSGLAPSFMNLIFGSLVHHLRQSARNLEKNGMLRYDWGLDDFIGGNK